MSAAKQLAATLFPIEGLKDHTFRLRWLRIVDEVPRDDNTPIRLERWASQLWRILKQPVRPSWMEGKAGFLVPDSVALAAGTELVLPERSAGDVDMVVKVSDLTRDIRPGEATEDELWLAAEMVKRIVSDAFGRQTNKYWRLHWNCYFRLEPENARRREDEVDAFRGLRFAAVFLDGKDLFLAADVVTRYMGRKPLTDYGEDERADVLASHLDKVRFDQRGHFMRNNIAIKRACKFSAWSDETVATCRVSLESQQMSVLDYYRQRYPQVPLRETDPVVYVKDQTGEQSVSLPVPATRLFPVFTTDYDEMKSCSVMPQLSPEERVQKIREFLHDLTNLRLGECKIHVSDSFFLGERSVFSAPALEYGDGHILASPLATTSNDEDAAYTAYRRAKTDSLYDHGIFSKLPLPDIVLFCPEDFPRPLREKFLQRLGEEFDECARMRPTVVRQRRYRVGRGLGSVNDLVRNVRQTASNLTGPWLGLVVLADSFGDREYHEVKDAFQDVSSQCVMERTVSRIAKDSAGAGYSSRLRNLVLAVLTEAGIQPWVLADTLHHDFHVGVDVLNGVVNYTFLLGSQGRVVWSEQGQPLRRRGLREKIDRVELRDQFMAALRFAAERQMTPNSLVVHRDGRWWESEQQGLEDAIRRLKHDGVLQNELPYAVVEIRKSSLPVRVLTKRLNGDCRLENPMPGTHLRLDSRTALLTTTGQPGWDRQARTASTLVLKLARAVPATATSLINLAEDVYRLTHLNWNAPEIEISLPVTIRWSDKHLREQALPAPDNEANDNETPQD